MAKFYRQLAGIFHRGTNRESACPVSWARAGVASAGAGCRSGREYTACASKLLLRASVCPPIGEPDPDNRQDGDRPTGREPFGFGVLNMWDTRGLQKGYRLCGMRRSSVGESDRLIPGRSAVRIRPPLPAPIRIRCKPLKPPKEAHKRVAPGDLLCVRRGDWQRNFRTPSRYPLTNGGVNVV
jgi:hypothetical protein